MSSGPDTHGGSGSDPESGDAGGTVETGSAGEEASDPGSTGSEAGPPASPGRASDASAAPAACPVCDTPHDSATVHETGLMVNLIDNARYRRVCVEPLDGGRVRFYHHTHEQAGTDGGDDRD